MKKIEVKNQKELEIMREGGKKLSLVKNSLREKVATGISAWDIETLASELINKEGAIACFKNVPGYSWATCVNINDGVVHGIPKKTIVFKNEDIVSVDLGLMWKGFNLDTSFSVVLSEDPKLNTFLDAGKKSLKNAIEKAVIGARIFDISEAIENTLHGFGLNPVKGLVGHGIGRKLHDYPYIPCDTLDQDRNSSPTLEIGNTLAVEVMYTSGSGEIVMDEDGWTIKAADGKITGLFEDTIEITKEGPEVLT